MTLASVIIPAWNGAQDLPICLDALLAQTGIACEIIVVDNASTDGTADLVAARYPQVQLLRHSTNQGFGGGCNAGLAQAQGDLLILLNQDTEVRPGWLAALAAAFDDPAIGIAGSKALYPDGTIQHAGGRVDEQGTTVHLGCGEADLGQHDQTIDVDYVTGASLALSRHAYANVGGFDPAFDPAYFEDVDLCYRARHAGFGVIYVPTSVLVHRERSVALTPSRESLLLYHRNRIRMIGKHWPQARLKQGFLPAERKWLEGMGPGGEHLITAAHEAYLIHLLGLSELAEWRQQYLGEAPEAIATLAEVLLELHAVYPLAPAGISGPAAADSALAELAGIAEIREHRFDSSVPWVGKWITAFRRQWNRVSAEWSVRAVVQQQNRVNATVLAALYQRLDTERRLAAYQLGQAHEMGRLIQEINDLKAKLHEQERR